MESKFLKDFISMRQKLHKQDKPTNKTKAKEQQIFSTSIASIIEKKPPTKDIIEFFRQKLV